MQASTRLDGPVTQLRRIHPGDRDWLVDRHIALYRAECGFDESFGLLVAEIVDAFLARHDPSCEVCWIAEQKGAPVGSIFCVKLDAQTAQLRLFFLEPEARSRGLGRLMLKTCMEYARNCGYRGMRLWTHRRHTSACALYRSTGWRRVAAEPKVSFGQNEIVETYVYEF